MENKLTELFRNKGQGLLSIYFTAGYPKLNDTVTVCKTLEENGVDFVEIGIPFSDSLVDGPTIQMANEQALKNGMSIKVLFDQLKDLREQVSMPIVLMGCINPIEQFGVELFCQKASEVGVDGVIIPDLPPEIYLSDYKGIFEKYSLSFVSLVTQHTDSDRVKYLDALSQGFLYAVSSDAITGGLLDRDPNREAFLERLKSLDLKNPFMLGFGISNRETLDYAQSYSSGGIIGSAFIRVLESAGPTLESKISEYIRSLR